MPVRLKPIAEQTIVITGASSGIGLATAHAAAAAGAAVILSARNHEALQEACDLIGRRGGRAAFVTVDIADEDAAERIIECADRRFGGFDTWINNAAAATFGRLADTAMEEHRRIFDVGYFGLVAGSLAAAERLKATGGALINVGSVLSERAAPLQGPYSAMKHAVQGFTEALRAELEMDGAPISVTMIKPAAMNTPFPEHARNRLSGPARVPPPLYDPRLVARAICHAAEHPKRDIIVGGAGFGIVGIGNAFPRATDFAVELLMGEPAQTIDTPPEPDAVDNLFEPRSDGRIESNQPVFVRRSSLTLEAQLHPFATAAIVGGAAAAGIAGAMLSRWRKEPEPDLLAAE